MCVTTSVFSLKPLKIKKPTVGNPHLSELNELCLQVNGVTRLLDGVLENQNDRTVSESPSDHIKLPSSIRTNSVSRESPKIVEVTEFMDGFLGKTWFGMETSAVTVVVAMR